MKKLFLLAALALPLLFACNGNNNNPDNPKQPVNLTQLQYTAISVEFPILPPELTIPSLSARPVIVDEIVLFRSGRFCAFLETAEEFFGAPAVKSDDDEDEFILTGTYTKNGNTVSLGSLFSFTIGQNAVTINGEQYSAIISETTVTANTPEDYAARSWRIAQVEAEITKPAAAKFKKTFSGTKNISVLAEELDKTYGVLDSSDAARIKPYDVKEINLNPNAACIVFVDSNLDPFTGSWKMVGQDGFSYSIDDLYDSPIFNSVSAGKIEFSGNQCVISLNVRTSEITGSFSITLQEAK